MTMVTKNNSKYSDLINPQAPIFPISIISDMIGVHQRTLRIYDEAGLLVPQRTDKNRRLYSMEDAEKGKFIQYLTRDLGINLSGVRIIFALLEQLEVSADDYISHLQKVAKKLNITPEEQAKTREMLLKRGRKPKNAK